mgnify:CR=1 FL=1
MQTDRYIAHVDMDAFFASIEQRDNPSLKGKPVIVGADPKRGKGRGVVSACSYEARKFGVHSAMPISIAYRQCPHGVFLPVDIKKYSGVSREIYEILYNFTPEIQPISIDEAFLDITGSYRLFGTPRDACLLIKSRIKDETLLTASIGLASTKMAAKIASDLEKPDGMVLVKPGNLSDFLRPLDISRLWGLGKKTEAVLKNIGINTIGDLAKREIRDMERLLGKNGVHIWQLANGIDDSEVETDAEAKSISNELTFEEDTADKDKIEAALMSLCEKISNRLRCENLKGRTITLKIRLEDFHTYTRATTIDRATNYVDVIHRQIDRLCNDFGINKKKIRLLGVRVSNLMPAHLRDDLFGRGSDEKMEKVHAAVDKIKEKFGSDSIRRAVGI